MGATSYNSTIRSGGKPLRLAHPIHGRDSFRPSGNPDTDPPEITTESDLDQFRRVMGLDTRAGVNAWDRDIAEVRGARGLASIRQCQYWDSIRFLQGKSPRARKRAEERERRKTAKIKK